MYPTFDSVELLFSMIWMIFGAAFYSQIIGIVTAFFSSKDTKETLVKKKLNMIEDFSNELNLEQSLRDRLAASIVHSSDKLSYLWLSPEEDIFKELTVPLKLSFLMAIHDKLISECSFFQNKDISFVVRIVPLLKPIMFKAGEVIWRENDSPSMSSLCLTSLLPDSRRMHHPVRAVHQRREGQPALILRGEAPAVARGPDERPSPSPEQ